MSSAAKLRAEAAKTDADSLRQSHGVAAIPAGQWKFLTPLLWAPTFPLIRLTTSHPRLQAVRPYVIGGCIVVANLHGFWLINNPDLSDEALGISRA
mmetsp:Transcript_60536/g.160113  ORF Transcript_60536/g.160113 Transcript_60536/m.160113 type:complete len:96 (+) Transcript_60536:11-298(+)